MGGIRYSLALRVRLQPFLSCTSSPCRINRCTALTMFGRPFGSWSRRAISPCDAKNTPPSPGWMSHMTRHTAESSRGRRTPHGANASDCENFGSLPSRLPPPFRPALAFGSVSRCFRGDSGGGS
jgi:hypothetical protein